MKAPEAAQVIVASWYSTESAANWLFWDHKDAHL